MTSRLKAFLGESPNANIDFRRNRFYSAARCGTRELAKAVAQWPRDERQCLALPLRRASRLVAVALARAFAYPVPEAPFFSQLMGAMAHCREVQCWLDHALDAGCLTPDGYLELNAGWEKLAGDLGRLLERTE